MHFLLIIENLSANRHLFELTPVDDDPLDEILEYLNQRLEISRIISSCGLMEPQFNSLADDDNIEGLREYPRARVNQFLLNLPRTVNIYTRRGGKKTRRRRPARSQNKTHRKNSQLRVRTSSASHKSTCETNSRNKTKRLNQPKKHKTRKKRNC